jgi:hypothetical protein
MLSIILGVAILRDSRAGRQDVPWRTQDAGQWPAWAGFWGAQRATRPEHEAILTDLDEASRGSDTGRDIFDQ